MSAPMDRPGPAEPTLDMDDIQGICVPGFFKPRQLLLGIRYTREQTDIVRLRQLLSELASDIATAAQTLTDRRGHREDAKSGATPREWPPLVAIGFGFQGLFDLTPSAAEIASTAFQNGLVRRSALLGDERA